MKRTLLATAATIATGAVLALPAGAAAQDPNCDQPHSLNPPRLNCSSASWLNEYLAVLDPFWS